MQTALQRPTFEFQRIEAAEWRGDLHMDHIEWLLSAIDDPEAIRLNALLLVLVTLIGCLAVLLNRLRRLRPAARTVPGAD
jgi:hypothetical protein